ncbi:OCIA domain-containing protein 1-like isoform 2-T2 [Pholidichthys leucotaenia]
MSSSTTGFTEEQQRGRSQLPLNIDYIPTEEERRLLKECNHESFFYRSLPFSVVSMAVTRALVTRGTLSASPRFGSLPKVAFAGFFGYLAGKLSYMKTCQEKFKKLENSPLGEFIRQKTGLPPLNQSELSNADTQAFGTMFQSTETPSDISSSTSDYGLNPEPANQMGRGDDFSTPAQSFVEEEEPRRKSILYEDLRLKNRENYEVTLTQKTDTMLKSNPTRKLERPKKEVKTNKYGDTWEE